MGTHTATFAREIAFLYLLRVIMTLLGVPREDEPVMLRLTQELFSNSDPEFNRTRKPVTAQEALEGLKIVIAEFEDNFADATRKFRAHPIDHLNRLIANATIRGEYLTHRQIMGYYIITATAGHDTTSHTTSGAMWALAERPEMFAALKAKPELIGVFVEESIRWLTPVNHFMRSATRDIELGGQSIAKDDWLMLSFQSANRDETAFDAPFEFRLDRAPNPQIAFGYGPHVCLGQHLARMEMRLLWEELLPRLKSVELNGTPTRTISNFASGPKHVPIRFTAQ
jgi:cytochrome P450